MISLIILGESPYNKQEQRSSVPFGYSREWILKNKLNLKIKEKKFSRDSLGNFLKELARTFPDHSFENFDLTLESVVSRKVLILNCYEDSNKKNDVASDRLISLDSKLPFLALGSEAVKFARKFNFVNRVEALHPSPRSRKSFVGSGCFFELEKILNQNNSSLEWLLFGVKNEKSQNANRIAQ